jgi:DNA-binding transcriptional LysR family regulator
MDSDDAGSSLDPGALGQMICLTAVAAEGSYSAAADSLGVNHASTVQRRIKGLEKTLERRLVEYDQREHVVRLTSDGRAVLKAAETIAAGWRELRRDSNQKTTIRVAAFPAHVTNALAEAAAGTRSLHDAVFQWDVTDGHRADGGKLLLERLRRGEIDVAVVPKESRSKKLVSSELYAWNLVVVGRDLPPVVSVEQLCGRELGASPANHLSRDLLERLVAAKPKTVRDGFRVGTESESTEVLLALAADGFLSAVLPSDAVPRGTQTSVLELNPGMNLGASYWITHRRDADSLVVDFVERSVRRGQSAMG